MARAIPKVEEAPELAGNDLMDDLGFHRKYRPKNLSEVIGNQRAVKSLQTYLRAGKVPKAILFSGPRGCGKTTLSRCLAAELEVDDFDFKEYNSADFRGIDNARDILRKLSFKPMKSKYTIILLDECHMLTKDAQTALLKAFEEPPKHVIMILATTDPQMLIKTLIDRCVNFTVEEPEPEHVARYLLRPICKAEGVEVSKEVLIKIGESCGGSYRSAVIILNGVIGLPEEERIEAIDVIANSQNETLELCQGLNKGLGCKQLMSIARNLKGEPESTRWAVLGYFSTILASNPDSNMGGNAYAVMRCFEQNYFNTGKAGLLMSIYDYCFGANAEISEE